MPARPDSPYGSLGSVPSVTPETNTPNDYLNVQADPNAFGAQIGQAEQKFGADVGHVGQEAQQFAVEQARRATEARVNDDYANKYAPEAADLRSKYDQLRGQDKIAGYDGYVNGLQALNAKYTESYDNNPLGKQLIGGLVNRHIAGEIDGAKRELVESQKQFSDQSTYDLLKANNSYAADNYNNPQAVQSVADQNDAHIVLQYTNNDHDPTNENSRALIEQAQNNAKGEMADGMITRAVNSGDVATANNIRAQFSPVIPGYKQLQIDNFLHAENIRQTGSNGAKAVINGQPLPPAVGAPAAQVQSLVANAAQSSGIDPNNALTVARIESSMGQNLGSRGTIGQDKESAGQPFDVQAQSLCDHWKAAHGPAASALGRDPQGWEQYAVYQQGAGGGSALLKASQTNPNAKAVDVLEPLYSNSKDAMDAVVKNGGNSTMSVSDFLGHIKQLYADNESRANCDFGTDKAPGDQIMAPHQETGPVVQPGATPRQALMNFDAKAPDLLSRINAIPNLDVRQGVMRAFQREREVYQASATSYSATLINSAQKLAVDPKFTSMDQVPPELSAALLTEHPQTLTYMEKRADYNLKHASGGTTADQDKYGVGMNKTLNGIWSGEINSPTQLHALVSSGDLTIEGHDRAMKELAGKGTPEGEATTKLREQSYKAVRSMLVGKADSFGIPDPHAEETYGHAMALMSKAEEDAKTNKVPASEMYDPTNKNWIGNVAKPLVKTLDQRVAEIGGKQTAAPPMADRKIDQVYQSPNGPLKWTGTGWVKVTAPAVPLAGVNE